MARRHKRARGKEICPFKPGWVGSGIGETGALSVKRLSKLYCFYVLETPCENLSSMSVSLTERGWGSKPWKTEGNRLYGRLLTDLDFKVNENLFVCTSVNETKRLFIDAKLPESFKRDVKEEKIAFYHSEKAQFMSIARHLRNSLAHGRFAARKVEGETFMYLEDGKRGGEGYEVRARMVIRYSTLEKWMAILKKESDGREEDRVG